MIPAYTGFTTRISSIGEGVRAECDCGWRGPAQVRDSEVWVDIRSHLTTPHFPGDGHE